MSAQSFGREAEGRTVAAVLGEEAAAADWRMRAKCRGMDTRRFFPEGNNAKTMRQIEEVKAICARCPVITECAEAAKGEAAGIWAGRDEFERNGKGCRQPKAEGVRQSIDADKLETIRQLARQHSETEIAIILRMSSRTVARYKARLREAS